MDGHENSKTRNPVRAVADTESVRRQNRRLVLSALRNGGAMSRTQLATATGLSHASITAIGGELMGQGLLLEGESVSPAGTRGRPAVQVNFNRHAAHGILVELDVNQLRCSLVDYGGTLVDRIESPVNPTLFAGTLPGDLLVDRIESLCRRSPAEAKTLRNIFISAQGILDRNGDGLKWSPIGHLNGKSIVRPVRARFDVPTTLQKRGGLLAEGARLLYPETGVGLIAAVFVGSTVAMGIANPEGSNLPGEGATEFGHMNHLPGGARCRCGERGCIEAYAADYGVLRAAYGVPDQSPPAAAVPAAAYQELVHMGQSGRRNALHAFNVAGRAIGYGLTRLMTIVMPTHIIITGPGASAFQLMRSEIDAAFQTSLVCRIHGRPAIMVKQDERELIFQGMLRNVLAALDEEFSALSSVETRIQTKG